MYFHGSDLVRNNLCCGRRLENFLLKLKDRTDVKAIRAWFVQVVCLHSNTQQWVELSQLGVKEQLTNFRCHFLENRQASSDQNDVQLALGKLVHIDLPDSSGAAGDNWNKIWFSDQKI